MSGSSLNREESTTTAAGIDVAGLTTEEKRALIQEILRRKSQSAAKQVIASEGQKALWFLNQLAPFSSAYNFVYAGRACTGIDADAFQRAVNGLVQRHAVLRSTYEQSADDLFQVIHSQVNVPIQTFDAREWSEEHLQGRIREEADRPFDLQGGPVLRVALFSISDDNQVLMLCAHHIIADLWSMEILIRELWQLYAAERDGQSAGLPDLQAEFTDFVKWEQGVVSGKRGRELEQYWQEVLKGPLPNLDLATDRSRPATQTFQGDAYTWDLSAETTGAIRQLAHEHGVTPFVTILALYYVLLSRYTGQRDILIGTTTANRVRPEWERVVGYFLNQLVLRVDLSDNPGFVQLLKRTRSTVLGALDNQEYPFPLLVDRLHVARDPSRSPVFQGAFIWDKVHALHDLDPSAAPRAEAIDLEPVLMEQRGAPFDLTLIVFELKDSLSLSLRYNVDLFERATMERMAVHFDALVAAAMRDPSQCVSELEILPAKERQQLLEDWNRTACEWQSSERIHELIEANALRRGESCSIVLGQQEVSYAELNRRADELADQLRESVSENSLIGFLLPKSIDAVVTMLAVWKLRSAYLPLDPNYPPNRLRALLDDARPHLVITTQEHAGQLKGFETPRHILGIEGFEGGVPLRPETAHRNELAYVIYTSGSTGLPKGVLAEHAGLTNLVHSKLAELKLTPEDRVLQLNNLCFDASVWEIAGTLSAGATLVIPENPRTLVGSGLARLLVEQEVSVITLPPSILATLPEADLPALRIIVAAGEACPGTLVDRWGKNREFFNAYGPTEDTVCATIARCLPGERTPVIGRPIANQRVYILDESLEPVPVGIPGEIYLAGRGVARGYLGRPELTAERFLPNPFWSDEDGVMYKTGDLARYRADGNIEYLGRVDGQVKIRGYRIELGEVEATLSSLPDVKRAVVAARGQKGAEILTAYVILDEFGRGGIREIRQHAKANLPEYMVPARIIEVDAIPMTPNGKIDFAALPEEVDGCSLQQEYVAPRNPQEEILVEIWQDVLEVKRVGVNDNFFDLGGASIQAVRAVDLAGTRGLEIRPEALFQFQTIAELAREAKLTAEDVERESGGSEVTAANDIQPQTTRPANANSDQVNACIESLGVYLPPKIVTSQEVLDGCKNGLKFPLERMTGIKNRHLCVGEYSIDLARHAARNCMERSRYAASDVDLLICANISRYDGPQHRISFEPSTAARLKAELHFTRALAFDISNACAGFFTAIKVAESFLRAGTASRILVVSGEYISHLTETAQAEIDGFMDPRLACLTLADSGLAAMIDATQDLDTGFQALELFTLGQFHDLCIAKATDQPHGGAIMFTDPVKSSAVTIQQAVAHARSTLEGREWIPDEIDHLIMHQTSETTLDGAIQELNKDFGRDICSRDNTIFNIADRGNTATTTHLVAVADSIAKERIQAGDRAVFAITGSGQTVGTGLYRFDGLPDRMQGRTPHKDAERVDVTSPPSDPLRLRVESIGTVSPDVEPETTALLVAAGESCLQNTELDRGEISLLLHSGTYRTEFLCEPALAAIAAGELKINIDLDPQARKQTLAFDLLNGDLGTLNACHLATQMAISEASSTALILASEVENNPPELNQVGVDQTGSGMLLVPGPATGPGFVSFHFRSFPQYLESYQTETCFLDGQMTLQVRQEEQFESLLIELIPEVVREYLEQESVSQEALQVLLPPQRSPEFIARLSRVLGLAPERVLDATRRRGNLASSSLAHGFKLVQDRQLAQAGQLGLVVAAGAGLTVGCALYRF